MRGVSSMESKKTNLMMGKRIKELRRCANITQRELGEKLFVSEQAISKWERGLSVPDVFILPRLSDALSTSIDFILTGKENVRYVPLSPYDLCKTGRVIEQKKMAWPSVSYNGIEAQQDFYSANLEETLHNEPLPVPYLEKPPKVIDVSVGRQLFVDDFLIASTDLVRHYHQARKHPGNPVFSPETPLEKGINGHVAMAAPFSDGVWYDPDDGKIKLWYHAGWFDGTAYAESSDGLHFERVDCGLADEDAPNRCIPKRPGVCRDSAAIVLNRYYPEKRPYKMFLYTRPDEGVEFSDCAELYDSEDGKKWELIGTTGCTGDRSTIFYNPFRDKWVYSMRTDFGHLGVRARSYVEADTLEEGAPLSAPIPWARCDRLDPILQTVGKQPSLYNLDAIAYESIMLGAFAVFMGPENDVSTLCGVPKHTELHLAYSRDGFHWSRPQERIPFIAPCREDPKSWERGYIHSNNGICIIRDDELWFYYTAFQGDETLVRKHGARDGMYANASMGLAKLRRDGFASMDAYGYCGHLTTRPIRFQGKHLFINGDFHAGELRAALLDESGNPIPGFSFEDCQGFFGNSTKAMLTWKHGRDLSNLVGRAVQLSFACQDGSLYAFWFSDTQEGKSHGALAAGENGKSSYWDR